MGHARCRVLPMASCARWTGSVSSGTAKFWFRADGSMFTTRRSSVCNSMATSTLALARAAKSSRRPITCRSTVVCSTPGFAGRVCRKDARHGRGGCACRIASYRSSTLFRANIARISNVRSVTLSSCAPTVSTPTSWPSSSMTRRKASIRSCAVSICSIRRRGRSGCSNVSVCRRRPTRTFPSWSTRRARNSPSRRGGGSRCGRRKHLAGAGARFSGSCGPRRIAYGAQGRVLALGNRRLGDGAGAGGARDLPR